MKLRVFISTLKIIWKSHIWASFFFDAVLVVCNMGEKCIRNATDSVSRSYYFQTTLGHTKSEMKLIQL